MSKEKYQSYLKLSETTYDEAVKYLLNKYGPATEKTYRKKIARERNQLYTWNEIETSARK